jgi:teichoic acid transport system ATP-binding protein
MSDIVIDLKNVTKQYKLYSQEKKRLLGLFFKNKKVVHYELKTANDQINLQIERGESVALFGENGAGKSTLLKIITGVVYPTSGEVQINGQVSAMLELTAGFDSEFTGREKIYLKGMLLGISKAKMAEVEGQIIEFSNIGEYIDQPVRTYSSGMKARLGFSVIAFTDPDILVIDEALSVGDKKFQAKCRAKVDEIRSLEHVTVLFVTHSIESAKEFCERGVVLESGKIVYDGEINSAIKHYEQVLAE